jgi:hypothetical protein
MKMNCIINTARFLNRFGKAWLIKGDSSTFLVGKKIGIGFSGGAYDTRKSVSTDIGAG